jgi:hypothetical protein
VFLKSTGEVAALLDRTRRGLEGVLQSHVGSHADLGGGLAGGELALLDALCAALVEEDACNPDQAQGGAGWERTAADDSFGGGGGDGRVYSGNGGGNGGSSGGHGGRGGHGRHYGSGNGGGQGGGYGGGGGKGGGGGYGRW